MFNFICMNCQLSLSSFKWCTFNYITEKRIGWTIDQAKKLVN